MELVIEVQCQQRSLVIYTLIIVSRSSKEKTGNIPLGQTHDKVPAGTVNEASDAEPARLTSILRPTVARDGVSDVFLEALPRAGSHALGRVSQVADDGDAGDGARRGGAECASSSRSSDGGAAQQEGRHCDAIIGDRRKYREY